jgi:hypothetical protein
MDNEELKAENARLKAENEKYRRCFQAEGDWVLMEPGEHAILTDRVKRLTKAGDELWEFAKLADTNAPKARRKALKDWLAAKKGRQSHG